MPSLQAAPDLTYLKFATQAAKWILSREEHERTNAGYWPSRADLPVEEKCDLYYGNAGTRLSLGQELRRAELVNLAVQAGTDLLARSIPTAHGRYWLHEIGAEKQAAAAEHWRWVNSFWRVTG